jgi:hypothetical protein
MGSHRRYLGLATVALTLGCAPVDPTFYPPRPKPVDAGTAADCVAACGKLAELGCVEGQPTPGVDRKPGTADDVPCEEVCTNVEESGVVTLDPRCVVQIVTCEEIEACAYGE